MSEAEVASTRTTLTRRAATALLVFGLSTTAGLYFASQLHFAYPPPVRRPWGEALAINLAYYWAWGAAVPLVVALGRRHGFEPGRRIRSLTVHFTASVALTAAQIAAASLLLALLGVGRPYSEPFSILKALRTNFHSSFPTYWLILFAWLSFDYLARLRERELRASQLEARLAEARLLALRTQLNPHFLFNALNSISSLMYSDVAAADAMMTRLAELLRLTLDLGDRQEVTLREELAIVERYLEIERIRFEDRLRVKLDVDPLTLDAQVPVFTLQPLVENAVRHAIAPRPEGGCLELSARREDGRLRLSILDDGPGLPAAGAPAGLGLANTRARLAARYGDAQRLELLPRPQGGLEVRLVLPFAAGP